MVYGKKNFMCKNVLHTCAGASYYETLDSELAQDLLGK